MIYLSNCQKILVFVLSFEIKVAGHYWTYFLFVLILLISFKDFKCLAPLPKNFESQWTKFGCYCSKSQKTRHNTGFWRQAIWLESALVITWDIHNLDCSTTFVKIDLTTEFNLHFVKCFPLLKHCFDQILSNLIKVSHNTA